VRVLIIPSLYPPGCCRSINVQVVHVQIDTGNTQYGTESSTEDVGQIQVTDDTTPIVPSSNSADREEVSNLLTICYIIIRSYKYGLCA
jgi:hypothetical protein